MTVESAPFSIMRTTDRPFLARLKLEMVGGESLPLFVDHWVEVSPLCG